jgi:hypothetical protein
LLKNILELHSQGQLSDGAALSAIYELEYGSMEDKELAATMKKSTRTVQRYRSELSNLSPVSCNLLYTTHNNNITNYPVKPDSSFGDKISTFLDKIDKPQLAKSVISVFRRTGQEFNEKALEYIINYCEERYKKRIVRKFIPYLLHCIEYMWDEAVAETSKAQEIHPVECEIQDFTLPQEVACTVVSDQDAEQAWNQVLDILPHTGINNATLNMWFKTATPIRLEDNTVILHVESQLHHQILSERYCNHLMTAFKGVNYDYKVITTLDIAS